MAKVIQTADELNRHLRDNIGFLEASCTSFDAGFFGEARRLSTTIRVLLHDTNSSQSLLGLLNLKESIRYANTATPHDPRNLLAYHGLVGFRFGPDGARYWAPYLVWLYRRLRSVFLCCKTINSSSVAHSRQCLRGRFLHCCWPH